MAEGGGQFSRISPQGFKGVEVLSEGLYSLVGGGFRGNKPKVKDNKVMDAAI